MSETEHHRGTLTPVEITTNIETTAKILLEGQELDSWHDTWRDKLEEDEGYHVTDSMIYIVADTETPDYEDIFLAIKNDDGTISYETKYYNGGCGFNEAIDLAIENIDKVK